MNIVFWDRMGSAPMTDFSSKYHIRRGSGKTYCGIPVPGRHYSKQFKNQSVAQALKHPEICSNCRATYKKTHHK